MLTLLFQSADALAFESLCEYYKSNEPELYKAVCNGGSGGGSGSTKPAGANSTFSDAFNISAASLPTEPSSYGLETIGSYLRDDSGKRTPTFSLIKGFHKFGTGISTSSNNTFNGNDVVQRLSGNTVTRSFEPAEVSRGRLINLNLGTSVLLIDAKSGPKVHLGVTARYNKITNTWGGGPAVLLSWSRITVGAGFTRERVSNFLPRLLFKSFLISARLSIFEFEYTVLDNDDTILQPIQILSATMAIRKLSFTAATRKLDYVGVGYVHQQHYAVQYMFSKHFSAGFLFNYIPGANSVGAQFYL